MLRAALGARTLSEFPLVVSVLFVVSVVRLTRRLVWTLTFFVFGTLRVSRQKACLASRSLP